jgi:hypothetical protein
VQCILFQRNGKNCDLFDNILVRRRLILDGFAVTTVGVF